MTGILTNRRQPSSGDAQGATAAEAVPGRRPGPARRWVVNPLRRAGATFRVMPPVVKLCALWLVFIVVGALYARLDRLVGQALPLDDPFYQGNLFGTASVAEGSSTRHVLGTDLLARDTFARLTHGGFVSLTVAVVSATFGVVVGGLLGSFVGYVRGRAETVVMSVIDVILAFPALILLLAMVSIFEIRSLPVISVTIGMLSIPAYTRVSRANTLSIANREFVLAARAIGTRRSTILFREIIPNVLPTLLAYALVAAAFVIVVEGTLSFLGLSVQLPEPTWGNMINEGRRDIRQTILPVLWPSLWLTFTVLSLNQVGDWLQKRANVRESAL